MIKDPSTDQFFLQVANYATGSEKWDSFKVKLMFTWSDDYLQHHDSERPKVSIPMMAFYSGLGVEDLYLDIVDIQFSSQMN